MIPLDCKEALKPTDQAASMRFLKMSLEAAAELDAHDAPSRLWKACKTSSFSDGVHPWA